MVEQCPAKETIIRYQKLAYIPGSLVQRNVRRIYV